MSAYVPGDDDRLSIGADLQHFLQKPFTSQRLLEKVRAVLDAR